MNILKGHWSVGEMVSLPHGDEMVKQSRNKTYKYELPPNCICLRKAEDYCRGIMVADLGTYSANRMLMVDNKTFCKDNKTRGFYDTVYYCYPFPSVREMKEVLDIIRKDPDLQQMLREQQMYIDPSATFWVSDTRRSLFPWKRKALYYNPQTDSLSAVKTGDDVHHRITIAYFVIDRNNIE